MLSLIIPAMELVKKRNLRFVHRKRFTLHDTIESIATSTTVDHGLLVVVNNTHDRALVDFVTGSPRVSKYALCSANVGVPRAWIIGAMISEGESLCFCNDDVEVGLGAIEALLEVLHSHPSIGEAGPAGGKWSGVVSGPRVGLEVVEEADEVSGFFFMLKSEVYREVGGFDNAYTPAGCDEIDMSFAVGGRGYRWLVVPHLRIVHHGSHGISSHHADIQVISTEDADKRNKTYVMSKCASRSGQPTDPT